MLALTLAVSMLAVQPPALPEDPAAVAPAPALVGMEPESAEVLAEPADVIVVPADADDGALPIAEEVSAGPAVVVVVEAPAATDPFTAAVVDQAPQTQAVPQPPRTGAGRFVGGAVLLLGGVGLLSAATFEFADGRDTTAPLISQIPAGISMLVAGGVLIGTAARDQRRLAEWEAATRIDAKPMGTGMIVGGVTAITLGSMAAIATSIAVDMDLDAPRSIPAGWATAGVGLAGGTALLVAGMVRRAKYGKWRKRVTGVPMVAPTRAGATLGLVGQF